jgi:predicted dehydrogenase
VKKLGIGLAGVGRMGRIHATDLVSRCARAGLACLYDADAERAAALAAQLDVPVAASFEELLERSEAVAIATPTGSHAELSVTAARAGLPVFCEKPLSLDRATTVDAIAAVEAAGVVFQVGFHRRYDPDWVAAAERIRAGELGEVTLFRTSLRDMNPPDPAYLAGSGGFFVDVTVHDLDVARWLVGEVVEVSAHGTASDPAFAELGDIDTAVVVLRFANGALGVIDNSRGARYGYECSTEVMGTLATARIDQPHRRGLEWRSPGVASRDLVRDFEERYPQAYAAELDGFAECVRTGGEPRVTGRDALAAFDLAVAADTSWRTGCPVAVDSEWAGAVLRGRRAGSEERATEHRRSRTAP